MVEPAVNLGAGALRDLATDIWAQNREDFVSTSDLERRASSYAVAVALDGVASARGAGELGPGGVGALALIGLLLVFRRK